MRYVVSFVVSPSTILAVNVGGAVIPTLMSAYLVLRYQLWPRAAIAIAVIAFIVHSTATPVAGIGIAVPVFVPVVATAILALVLFHEYAAPLAYVGGSLGTLIGADILNLNKIGSLGAPIASIGGAGTFDGIFLTGILAVLLAGLLAIAAAASVIGERGVKMALNADTGAVLDARCIGAPWPRRAHWRRPRLQRLRTLTIHERPLCQ